MTSRRPATEQQFKAIAARKVSVALSAGAGCGKTFVLTERYLAELDPDSSGALLPGELKHLVAITFTERAAREMRERIRSACYKRLLAAPDEQVNYWLQLVRALDGARISTIHSFCASLLRWRAVEAGLDPAFDVLEQNQSESLLLATVDDRLRKLISQRDPDTLALAANFDLNRLAEMLRRLVIDSAGQPLDEWLAMTPEQLVARWSDYHRTTVIPAIVASLACSRDARRMAQLLATHVPTNDVMRERRVVLQELFGSVLDTHDARGLADQLKKLKEHARVQGGGQAKAWPTKEVYEAVRDSAEGLRSLVDKLLPITVFDPDAAIESATVGSKLLAIAAQTASDYQAAKRQLRALDFDDLLTRARALLVDPAHAELRRQVGGQIQLLLVDEFQDTDPLQVELVAALCGEAVASGKLFFVGDPKQSIYRFRGADPHVFSRLAQQTPAAGRLSLTVNFRSQPAILQFVNGLFWDDLVEHYEPLRPHRVQVSPQPAIEFLWPPKDAETKEKRRERWQRQADWIARRVRAMLDAGEPMVWDEAAADQGTPAARPPRPGDIAILFRALTNVQDFEAALKHYEIDYYLVGGHAFYAQQEIFDVVNLLRTLSSPSDLVSLTGVLRSGFFSLADETIFWLAQHPEGLAAGLESTRAANVPRNALHLAAVSDEQFARAYSASATLEELRSLKDRLRISELLNLALARTGYDAALVSEFLGERKLANLRKLIDQSRRFDRSGAFGLNEFIEQVAEFVANQPKEPLAAIHAEDSNVVRLMTIHQAKGLEFPIVIVPDVDFTPKTSVDPARLHAQLGPLVKLPDDAETGRTGGHALWSMMESLESAAEQLRLLYVATTRAADYLLLAGEAPSGESRRPWLELLQQRFDLASGQCIAALPPGEVAPPIRVTVEAPPVNAAASVRRKNELAEVVEQVEQATWDVSPPLPAIQVIPPDQSARVEYSFSSLTGQLQRESEVGEDAHQPVGLPLPAGPGVDSRALGTLVHAVLAAIDFSQPQALRPLVELHADRLVSTGEESAAALTLLDRFLVSPRARQLAQAKQSHVEAEFWLPWTASERRVLIRGFIDRLYQDHDGHWHVIDFKTNRVSDSDLPRVAGHYELQMQVYAAAVERIFHVPPRSLTLHFLRTGSEWCVEWNDAARTRLEGQIRAAISLQQEHGTLAGG